MADAIDALTLPDEPSPDALTLAEIIAYAEADFAIWLRERKNARRIPHRLEACGYVAVRNDASTDGRWKVNKRNVVIYAKATLSVSERISAARKLAGQSYVSTRRRRPRCGSVPMRGNA
jgi:hypothetical protein